MKVDKASHASPNVGGSDQSSELSVSDWNAEPEDVVRMNITLLLQGELLRTGHPTVSGGREIHFGVVDKRLNGACKICAVDEVPWAPHLTLQVTAHNELAQAEVPTLMQKSRLKGTSRPES